MPCDFYCQFELYSTFGGADKSCIKYTDEAKSQNTNYPEQYNYMKYFN